MPMAVEGSHGMIHLQAGGTRGPAVRRTQVQACHRGEAADARTAAAASQTAQRGVHATHQGTCQPAGLCSRGQQAWKDRVTRNQASTIYRQARLVWPRRVQLSGSVSSTSWGQPSRSASSA